MATTPAYAATPNNGSVVITGTETDIQVPTQAVLVLTAGSNGSKVEEIDVSAIATTLIPTTVAGLVYIFLYNGSTYFLFDTYTVTAITASATASGFRLSRGYPNLILKTGWSIYASQSIAGNAGKINVSAFGGDY